MTIKINKDNFVDILKDNKKVLVDFWGSWCTPCGMIGPVLDNISEEGHDFVIGKINVDEERDLARSFGISSVPTLVAIKNDRVVEMRIGAMGKEQIIEMMK